MAGFKTMEFMINKVEELTRKATTEEAERKHLEMVVEEQGREIVALKIRVSELETCIDKMKNITVNVHQNDGIIGGDVSESTVNNKSEGGVGDAG